MRNLSSRLAVHCWYVTDIIIYFKATCTGKDIQFYYLYHSSERNDVELFTGNVQALVTSCMERRGQCRHNALENCVYLHSSPGCNLFSGKTGKVRAPPMTAHTPQTERVLPCRVMNSAILSPHRPGIEQLN